MKESEQKVIISLSGSTIQVEDKNIIENINFDIRKGEKIDIIGKNGCGKSSFMKVLAGLYHWAEGEFKKRGLYNCIYTGKSNPV